MKNRLSVFKALAMGFSQSFTSVLLTLALGLSLGSELFAMSRSSSRRTASVPGGRATTGAPAAGRPVEAGDPYARLTDEARRLDADDGSDGFAVRPRSPLAGPGDGTSGAQVRDPYSMQPGGDLGAQQVTGFQPQGVPVVAPAPRSSGRQEQVAMPVFRAPDHSQQYDVQQQALQRPSGDAWATANASRVATQPTSQRSLLRRPSQRRSDGSSLGEVKKEGPVTEEARQSKKLAREALPLVVKATRSLWKSSNHFLSRHFKSKEAMDQKFAEKIAKMKDLSNDQQQLAIAQFKQGFIDAERQALPAHVRAKISRNLAKYRLARNSSSASTSNNDNGLFVGRGGIGETLAYQQMECNLLEAATAVEITGPLEMIGNILGAIFEGIASIFD